jgi:hypothetical protein
MAAANRIDRLLFHERLMALILGPRFAQESTMQKYHKFGRHGDFRQHERMPKSNTPLQSECSS